MKEDNELLVLSKGKATRRSWGIKHTVEYGLDVDKLPVKRHFVSFLIQENDEFVIPIVYFTEEVEEHEQETNEVLNEESKELGTLSDIYRNVYIKPNRSNENERT